MINLVAASMAIPNTFIIAIIITKIAIIIFDGVIFVIRVILPKIIISYY